MCTVAGVLNHLDVLVVQFVTGSPTFQQSRGDESDMAGAFTARPFLDLLYARFRHGSSVRL